MRNIMGHVIPPGMLVEEYFLGLVSGPGGGELNRALQRAYREALLQEAQQLVVYRSPGAPVFPGGPPRSRY